MDIKKKDGLEIASRFIQLAQEINQNEYIVFLPHRKLQGFLSLLNLIWYKKTEDTLINEQLEFFKITPVSRKVYSEYAIFGENHLKEPARDFVFIDGKFKIQIKYVEPFEEEIESIMRDLLVKYGKLNVWEFSDVVYSIFKKKERETPLEKDDYEVASEFL